MGRSERPHGRGVAAARLQRAARRSIVASLACVAAGVISGTAYASMSATGRGAGTAPVGAPVPVEVQAPAGVPAGALQPGGTGDLLVQVADLHQVRVRAFVDEPEIGRLQPGQPVEVSWDALPGRVWKGSLETLPTTVVPHGTRMVGEVTCVIDNQDLKLLPNTNVGVAVVTARQENVLTVPREAIHQDENGQYVFQVVDGELQRKNVTTSVSNLTRVEVTSGISDNAVLALGALNMQSLKGGMAVKVAQ